MADSSTEFDLPARKSSTWSKTKLARSLSPSPHQIPLPASPPPVLRAVAGTSAPSNPQSPTRHQDKPTSPLSPRTNFSSPFYASSPVREETGIGSGAIDTVASADSPPASPTQALPLSPSPTTGRTRWQPNSPPPRPPRPCQVVSELRPTVIVSPELLTALPPCDRPPVRFTDDPLGFGNSFSSSNDDLLPSPTIFQPQHWSVKPSCRPVQNHDKARTTPAVHKNKFSWYLDYPCYQNQFDKQSNATSSSSSSSSASPITWMWAPLSPTSDSRNSEIVTALPLLPGPAPTGPLPHLPVPSKKSSTAYQIERSKSHALRNSAEEKIPVDTLPPHLQPGVTEDITYPPEPLSWQQRHRRKLRIIITCLLILALAAGILGGIIWRLVRDQQTDGGGKLRPVNFLQPSLSHNDAGVATPTSG